MPEVITSDDALYALEIVKAICRTVGPGIPGSSQERERAAYIQKELEAHLGVENVTAEEFPIAPGAFLSAYPLSALGMLMAALLNISVGRFAGIPAWISASLALAFSSVAILLVVFQFILGREVVDRFFKKKRSVNVIGKLRKPGTQTVKRLLILSGHHDSAWENTWFRFLGDLKRALVPPSPQNNARENTWLSLLGYGFYLVSSTWLIGLVAMLVMSLLQLAGIIAGSANLVRTGTLGWGMLVYPVAPAILFALFFNRGRKHGGTVPGAADNLSASALVVAMCRFLAQNPTFIPDDVEIRFISFGSEEAGLRGSRRYVERHLDELKRLDARLLNFETVAYPEITILTSDVSGTVKNSPEMVESVIAAATRAGIPFKLGSASLGVANDSGSFSQAGLKATTLLPFKMPQQMVAFYHQKWDIPENLTIEPLHHVLKLTFEWIRCGGEQVKGSS